MRKPAPDYPTRQYERPNQPWTCGLAEHGDACSAGPTAGGGCPALAECTPKQIDDRWQCNRSALRGGPCAEGPTPDGGCGCVHKCHPVRSLRGKRGRFIAACAALAAGCAFLGLSADWRDRVIRPGALAQPHAQLLERGGGTANCRACHEAAAQNVAGWAMSLVVGSGDVPTQSQLCMNCHSKTIAMEQALAAHNVPANVLRQVSNVRGGIGAGDASHVSNVACATCHREHHGTQVSLTAMDNAACQSCHQERYASFAIGHPDFGRWPYERRSRIVFNHASHSGKHFAEKKQTFDCRTCHVSNSSGRVEQLASYEKACAGCHDEKIVTSVGQGVAMIALPTLDVAAMKKTGRDIGPWPQTATGDFDGKLPPAMKLLLASDPAAARALEKLGPGFEFQDVEADDAEHVAAAADLAVAIKQLMADLAKRGPVAVRERLSAVLGRGVTAAEAAQLTAGLSGDTLQGTGGWLPEINLQAEKGLPTSSAGVGMAQTQKAIFAAGGAWSRDDAKFAVRYRPAAHADPVLTAWLDVLAKTPNLESRPVAAAMFKELTKSTAPGLCASCHSAEQNAAAGNALLVNWRAGDRSLEPRTFTKFSHGPHLVLPQLTNCTSCHAINNTASVPASYADLDPRSFVSDFKPLAKQQCAECHTKTAAGDACQSCHNYHVQTVETWRLGVPVGVSDRQAGRLRFLEPTIRLGKNGGGDAPAR